MKLEIITKQQTDQQTDQPPNRRTCGYIGKLHFQKIAPKSEKVALNFKKYYIIITRGKFFDGRKYSMKYPGSDTTFILFKALLAYSS